jgi:hypothetical protein
MDLVWQGPCSDLGNRGHYDEVHAKTSRGPFFIPKKLTFCFPAGAGHESFAVSVRVSEVSDLVCKEVR